MDATGERGSSGDRGRQAEIDDDPAFGDGSDLDVLADEEPEATLSYRRFGVEVVPGGWRVRLVGGDTIGNSGP